ERDNMRVALSRAAAPGGDVESGLRLAASLSWFWLVRGDFAEGSDRLSTLLAAATALSSLGNAAYVQRDRPRARKWLEEGLAIQRKLGLPRRIAALLLMLGQLSSDERDYTTARSCLSEALKIEHEVDGGGSLMTEILERLGAVAHAVAGAVPAALIW